TAPAAVRGRRARRDARPAGPAAQRARGRHLRALPRIGHPGGRVHRPDRQGAALSSLRAFGAVLGRYVFVTGRELPSFLAQVLVQPVALLFIFGKVLGELGYTQPGYAQILLPGMIALNAFLVALQNTSFPLVLDFSFSREIE